MGQWQENNKELPTGVSCSPRRALPWRAQCSRFVKSTFEPRRGGNIFIVFIRWSLIASTNSEAHTLTEHPIHKAGCCFTFRPPQQVDNRGCVHQAKRETQSTRINFGNSKQLYQSHRPLYFHIYASIAFSASSEAMLLLWSAITHTKTPASVVRVNTPSSHGSLKTQAASMGPLSQAPLCREN